MQTFDARVYKHYFIRKTLRSVILLFYQNNFLSAIPFARKITYQISKRTIDFES